ATGLAAREGLVGATELAAGAATVVAGFGADVAVVAAGAAGLHAHSATSTRGNRLRITALARTATPHVRKVPTTASTASAAAGWIESRAPGYRCQSRA